MLSSKKNNQNNLKQKTKNPNWWKKLKSFHEKPCNMESKVYRESLTLLFLPVFAPCFTVFVCSFFVTLALSEMNSETQKYCY